MATFAPGDDVDGYCGECGQVLGDVILVTVQGSVTVRSVTIGITGGREPADQGRLHKAINLSQKMVVRHERLQINDRPGRRIKDMQSLHKRPHGGKQEE